MLQHLEVKDNAEVSIPDADYVLRDGAAWFKVNGMTLRVRSVGTAIYIRAWEGDQVFNEPIFEANVDPEWEDKDEGPWPNDLWYDTSKELE